MSSAATQSYTCGSIPTCQCSSTRLTFDGMIVGVVDAPRIWRCLLSRLRESEGAEGAKVGMDWELEGIENCIEECGSVESGCDDVHAAITSEAPSMGLEGKIGMLWLLSCPKPTCCALDVSESLCRTRALASNTSAATRRARRSFCCRTRTATFSGSGPIQCWRIMSYRSASVGFSLSAN